MLISIHVPKTAGTNFTKTLEAIYGSRIHMDYGTERDLTAARTCAPEIAADPAGFATRFDVIHGHYHYLKYDGVFPGAKVLATLRHPVSRLVSQYRHVALHGDPNNQRHRLIMEGQMDPVKFSAFHFVGNAQTVYVEGLGIDNLDYAIIQEHFGQTVENFCRAVGFDPMDPRIQEYVAKPINSRETSAWDSKAIPVDPSMFAAIEKNCALDMALYQRAIERFVS